MHYANTSLDPRIGARLLYTWRPFFEHFPVQTNFRNGLWHEECDHWPVSETVFRQFRGRFAGLFRQPEQRLVSAFHDKGGGEGPIQTYAERVKGTVVMQLAGQAAGEQFLRWPGRGYSCGGHGAATQDKPEPNLGLAINRLSVGFMFVGLMEAYDLSVCLFHAMYGGECLAVEFENMRPGVQHEKRYNASNVLGRWKDRIDGKLYEAAAKRFWSDIKKYRVNRQACKQICPNITGVFDRVVRTRKEDEVSLAASGKGQEDNDEYDWPGRYVLVDEPGDMEEEVAGESVEESKQT